MEEFEAQVSRALHLAIEAVTAIATETQHNLEALGHTAQAEIDEWLEMGAAQVNAVKARNAAAGSQSPSDPTHSAPNAEDQ